MFSSRSFMMPCLTLKSWAIVSLLLCVVWGSLLMSLIYMQLSSLANTLAEDTAFSQASVFFTVKWTMMPTAEIWRTVFQASVRGSAGPSTSTWPAAAVLSSLWQLAEQVLVGSPRQGLSQAPAAPQPLSWLALGPAEGLSTNGWVSSWGLQSMSGGRRGYGTWLTFSFSFWFFFPTPF